MADGIFGRCPTCSQNYFKLICDLSCSPEQDRFMRVTKSAVNEDNKEYATAIEVIRYAYTYVLRPSAEKTAMRGVKSE